MRKLLCALSLISALVFSLAVHAAAPTSFAGTWTLDKSKSQGLNQRIQGAESVVWTITQTDKTITIEEKVSGGAGLAPVVVLGAAPSSTPPAGGSSGRGTGYGAGRWWYGRRHGMGPRTFNLDGTETTARRWAAGKFVRKAKRVQR